MKERIFGLDFLRAFAILLVLIQHGHGILSEILPTSLLALLVLDGVGVFFVLSGFLVGDILLRDIGQRGASFATLFHFWIRRWFRTLPAYFLVLMLLIGGSLYLQNQSLSDVWTYFLFCQNIYSPHPTFFAEAWSLAVEEWFYLLFPFFVFLLMKGFSQLSTQKAVFLSILFFLIIALFFRLLRWYQADISTVYHWDPLLRKQVLTRLDALAIGVLAAWLRFYHSTWWASRPRLALCLGLSLFLINRISFQAQLSFGWTFNLHFAVFSFYLEAFGVLLMLPFLSTWRVKEYFLSKLIRQISLLAYSLYLVHYALVIDFVIPATLHFLPSPSGVLLSLYKYSLYWGYSFLLAFVLFYSFERPFMELRERFRGL